MRRPAILRRFPRMRAHDRSAPVIDPGEADRYPALAADLKILDEVVTPAFTASERAALLAQHRHRRQQVIILLGSALLTGLGGLQAILPRAWWIGLALAVLALVLTAVSRTADELKTLECFLDARVKAERLRAMYFRYLSRTGRYRTDDREAVLHRAVVAVERGEEPV